jgi:hypothetical protein
MRTVFLPQQLPLHAKDGVDYLLLLASHDDDTLARSRVAVRGGRVNGGKGRVLRR